MIKNRANYLYKFTGTIQKKNQRTNPKYSQYFYQLKVKLEGYFYPQKLFAFKSKTKSFIWNALETDSYIGKKYLFSCHNHQGHYHIIDWKEQQN